ncbi:MAG: hypothetical protein L3K26_16680 [Candidatus Hydrogenedentes bacterium]|nr:hypothetical protein [Candidatus Hydrogenedentota bacterium]
MNLQAQVTIGWDVSCDYDMNFDANGLQQAIDDGMSELRLTNENEFQTSLNIRNQIIIKGGYSNCLDAQSDTQTNINSVINSSINPGFSAVFIFDIMNK